MKNVFAEYRSQELGYNETPKGSEAEPGRLSRKLGYLEEATVVTGHTQKLLNERGPELSGFFG